MRRLTSGACILILVVGIVAVSGLAQNADAKSYGRDAAVRRPAGESEESSSAESVEGPRGGIAVGTKVTSLPESAREIAVAGQTYHVANGVYYLFNGSGYDVVDNPETQSFDDQSESSQGGSQTIIGTVQETDWVGKKLVVTTDADGNTETFIVPSDARMISGTTTIGLGDVEQGDRVEIEFVSTDDGYVVQRLNDTNTANNDI